MKDDLKRFVSHDLLNRPGDPAIGDDDDLLASGLVDSVGMMSLVLFVEERCGIEVPPEDVTIQNFYSIGTIEAYVSARRGRDE